MNNELLEQMMTAFPLRAMGSICELAAGESGKTLLLEIASLLNNEADEASELLSYNRRLKRRMAAFINATADLWDAVDGKDLPPDSQS